ncbi:unnamed protein product [Schistosoma turkestanicum]|nr:unnamed protein product [Schistosoma turkestanicum]
MLHSVGLSDPTGAATVVYPHFTPFPPTNTSTLNPNENSNQFTNNSVTNHNNVSNHNNNTTNNTTNNSNNNNNNNHNGMYTSNTAAAAAAAVAALTAAAAASAGLPSNIKDSRWLTLEVCRQYQRNQCSRDENECKFAHPPTHVDVQSGRVICCYDSIKGKCQRRDPPCKYLHPPQHLREQLIQNGRNNMIMRNVQLQLLQQQLLAQTGVGPLAAAAAAAAAATNPNQGTLVNNSNSLIYTTPAALALTNQTGAPSAYPLLLTSLSSIFFFPFAFLLALTGVSVGKPIGSWFGPNTVAQVLKKLSVYDRWTNLFIHISVEDGIIIDEIKSLCCQPRPYFNFTNNSDENDKLTEEHHATVESVNDAAEESDSSTSSYSCPFSQAVIDSTQNCD